MDVGERLSAYLAGELDGTDRAQLDAELERDPALRARLDRIRRTAELLDGLPAVSPRAGFDARLRHVLAAEPARPSAVTELAPARARRSGWAMRVAAAAAAVALIGGGAMLLTREHGPTVSEAERAAAPGAEADGARLVPILATDADHDADSVAALPPGDVGYRDVRAADAERLQAERVADLLQQTEAVALTLDQRREEPPADQPGTLEHDLSAVAVCLTDLLEGARTPVIPLYVELARFAGEPAIIYAFAAEEPTSSTYRRTEFWVVARHDCQVLHFAQHTN